jgi:hypothetical protein
MTERFPDLYKICKTHFSDKNYINETESEFIAWVEIEYLRSLPTTHHIPTNHRRDVEQEIKNQITQWLKVTLYGQSLPEARSLSTNLYSQE